MKKRIFKFASILFAVVLTVSSIPFSSSAASGTVYESESNNTLSTADATYDDYDNFGTISSLSDVDWWSYVAGYTGMCTFWLGSIPSNCNYDLFLYTSNGEYMACSVKTNSSQESIHCRVTTGTKYYIKIISVSGYSSSQYKFRVKNYVLNNAVFYVHKYAEVDNKLSGTTSAKKLNDLGYNAIWYLNSNASTVYDLMPRSLVSVIINHADRGLIRLNESKDDYSYFYAKFGSTHDTKDREVYSYEKGKLDDSELVIYAGCDTGLTDSDGNNLPYYTTLRGAESVIGWENKIDQAATNKWIRDFFNSCDYKNVEWVALKTDEIMFNYWKETLDESKYKDYEYLLYDMTNRYYGGSRPASVVI